MKLKNIVRWHIPVATIFTALVVVLLIGAGKFNDYRENVIIRTVLTTLNFYHYQPVDINDKFSETVFINYIEALDRNKKFFLAEDIKQVERYKYSIDEELNSGKYLFFSEIEDIVTKRIDEAEQYYKNALENPFDFTVDEEIELDPDKVDYANTKEELQEEWRKAMKYQVMTRIHHELSIQEKAVEKTDTVVEIKSFSEIEQKARQDLLDTHNDWFERLKKLDRIDRFASFINAVTTVYDPHTNYFPPKIREDFDIAMSGQLEGIGAVLTEKGGFVQVTEIVPGSPSWKQGDLKEGDVILKVAQGDDESVSIVGMRLDEAVKLIRGHKGSVVNLTVKKKIDDEIVLISITRDVVQMEETYAKSAIITSSKGKKTGYIFLPKFYVDFNNIYTGRSAARDVLLEIEKLKNDGVDAIILDLRNNGGGSLPDVVKMTGYFIKHGPVVQVANPKTKTELLKDVDPAIQYKGPVVVMVNKISASASEILAAALQDYQRAVIVGSPTTYGKGTVQQLIDLDMLVDDNEGKPLGSIKLTMQKFYRVNGGATQLKGVVPDIIIPDQYRYIEFGEKELDNPMPWSKIKSTAYQKWDGPFPDLKNLRKKSEQRVNECDDFAVIEEHALRIKAQREQTTETLNLEKYRAKREKYKKETEKFNQIMDKETPLLVKFTSADKTTFVEDSVKSEV
ncbi:MAG: carboxy terminal-processing peptidase, partial [Bacteroidales bacterium]|nr:carboxy terminal-processing peptidase [Bacteroidales bacterium]